MDQTIPKPPEGQLVDVKRLQQVLMTSRLRIGAFGGAYDPTTTWQMMVRNDGIAIPLYRELEDKDDDVSSALDEFKLSVLERDWSVMPGDSSQAALDASEFATAQLNAIDLDAVLDSMLDAAPYGFSVSELMFDTSEGQASLVSVDDCPQELFLFGDRFTPQVGQLQLLDSPFASSGTPVPEEKFAVFSYRGRARSRMGRPLLRSAFWPSWFKRQILGLWLKAGEKSNGTAIARYADQASATEQQFAVECAEALVDGVACAIPINMQYDIDLLKVTQSRDPAIYEKLFTQQQYAIHRAIKGETLTSFGNEGGKGSNAQGKTHADTFDKRSVSLAKKLNAVVTKQILYRLHLWNFGPNVPAPVFAFETAEEEDLTRRLAVLQGAQGLGIPIPAKWAAEQLQIPAVGTDDMALVANATAVPPALPGAAFAETSTTVKHEHGQLDALVAQLAAQSRPLLTERVEEITDHLRQAKY